MGDETLAGKYAEYMPGQIKVCTGSIRLYG